MTSRRGVGQHLTAWRPTCVAFSVLLATGCMESKPGADAVLQVGGNGAPAASPQQSASDSATGQALLQRLRERHAIPERPTLASNSSLAAVRAQASRRSALPPGDVGLHRVDDTILQSPPQDAEASHSSDLALPRFADAAFRLADKSNADMAIDVRLNDARGVEAEIADGYVLYPAAGPGGSTLLHRVIPGGVEDYVSFERAPTSGSVGYQVTLSAAVAGLRLVANTLELLDDDGDPRLRVASPYVVGADGEYTEAELHVTGCAVDRDPAPPWGRKPVDPRARVCGVEVRWDPHAVVYPALLDPAWSTTANMSVARAWHTSTLLSDGRVLVVGGSSSNSLAPALASAELYNPSTRTWAATGRLTTARLLHSATRLGSNRVLINGGYTGDLGGSTLRSAQLYNPATGTFITPTNMVTGRYSSTATLLPNGNVLVTGGWNGLSELRSAEIYNVTSNAWAATGNMGSVQSEHTAVLLPSTGRVLVLGDNAPAAQLFNPANGTFTTTASPAVPRNWGTATVLSDNRVLYAAGLANDIAQNVVEIFDPATSTWTRTGSLIQPRVWTTATRLSDGRVLVTGGTTYTFEVTGVERRAELFNPTWGTWSPMPALATGRYGHTAERLSSGRVLVTGGVPQVIASTATAQEFDPTTTATSVSEYRFAPAVDPDVFSGTPTELWASVHRPSTLVAGRRYPVVVMLHGRHNTCMTTTTPRLEDECFIDNMGTCPSGHVVIPAHLGYRYAADELAARDFIVISVNAGLINCAGGVPGDDGLNLVRGRLVLKHLQRLAEWNRGTSPTPASIGVSLLNKLDLSRIGLMGHSRGGEGVRAAYQQYRDAGSPWPNANRIGSATFRGIFEIGPVDGQTSRVLNADGVAWTVLLPMCDGDLSDLPGVRVFDRMITASSNEQTTAFKSTFTVWGANHNFYNTEWQAADLANCVDHRSIFTSGTGSAEQRQTGFLGMVSFFAANVSADTSMAHLNTVFDPRFRVVTQPIEPRIDLGFTPAQSSAESLKLEDFDQASGVSSHMQPTVRSTVVVNNGSVPSHPGLRGGEFTWNMAGANTFFETRFRAAGSGLNLAGFQFLDLRVARVPDTTLNPATPTDFSIALVNPDGSRSSAVNISSYVVLDGPVGNAGINGGPQPILQTARIPLSAFSGVSLGAVRGVRLTFAATATGHITVANIRATRSGGITPLSVTAAAAQTASAELSAASSGVRRTPGGTSDAPPVGFAGSQVIPQPAAAAPAVAHITSGNAVVRIATASDPSWVEVELSSTTPFTPRAPLLVLDIGSVRSTLSGFVRGDIRRVVFRLPKTDWDRITSGAPMSVRYDGRASATVWSFGAIDKNALDR